MADTRFTPIKVTKFSCLDLQFAYQDEAGQPIDITDMEFSVSESKPAGAFAAAVFTKSDPANGILNMHLPKREPETLGMGNVNWVRVERTLNGDCISTTEQIWIRVL